MCENIEDNLAHNVSLDEWVRATWYIQEQQITGYQPRESLFCVTATYNFENAQVPRLFPFVGPYWDGTVATVYNYANVDRVNGALQNSDNMTLCARVQDPHATNKLSVAPCFLPNYAAGPYWILSVGENETGHYEWAIVIGGEPTEPYADGCTTSQSGINDAGLWLFSRVPIASEETKQTMRQELASKGITSQKLIKVQQDDCTYAGAFIKT
jgi:apolipoprotein D and lipocalin family protein